MKRITIQTVLWSIMGLLSIQSCKSDDSESKNSNIELDTSTDADTDSDTDADTDTDTDADTDTDTDVDVDTDTDSDTDTDTDADTDTDTDSDGGQTAVCPESAPTAGDTCSDMRLRGCVFGDVTCDCRWGGGGAGLTWNCETSCPASLPGTGDTCEETQYSPCTYDAETCMCQSTDDATWTWTCNVVATECPTEQPEVGGMCDPTAISTAAPEGCAYGDTTCNCARRTNSWSCAQQCPATQPATGDACSELQNSPCIFDEETCTCSADDDGTRTWRCAVPATSCPDTQPTQSDPCNSEELTTVAPDGCAYGDMVCNCARWTNTFQCVMGCPAAAPATDDACVENQVSPCQYADSDQVCSCDRQSLTWTCNTAAGSCPDTQPENGDACLSEAIQAAGNCTYDNVECVCNRRNTFTCREVQDLDASTSDPDAGDM